VTVASAECTECKLCIDLVDHPNCAPRHPVGQKFADAFYKRDRSAGIPATSIELTLLDIDATELLKVNEQQSAARKFEAAAGTNTAFDWIRWPPG
jgi:hypothetical protein